MKGLLWSAILLLSVLAAVALVGRPAPSQALTPPAAGEERTGEGIAWTDVVTYYSHLPAVFADPPTVYLQESFDAGTGAWTPFLNHPRLQPGQWQWAMADGVDGSGALTQDCCAGLADKVAAEALMMYLRPGAQEWTDYRVETMMILQGGADTHCVADPNGGDPIGLWVRGHWHYSPLQSQWVSGYYVLLVGRADSSENYVQLSKMQQPGDCDACLKPERLYNLDNALPKARSIDLPGRFERNRWYKLAVEVRGASIKAYLDDTLVVEWTDLTLPYLSGTVGLRTSSSRTASFDNVSVRSLP